MDDYNSLWYASYALLLIRICLTHVHHPLFILQSHFSSLFDIYLPPKQLSTCSTANDYLKMTYKVNVFLNAAMKLYTFILKYTNCKNRDLKK